MMTANDQDVNDQGGLRQLGYSGELTAAGLVVAGHVDIPLDRQVEVTREMADLLADIRVGAGPVHFFLHATSATATFPRKYRTRWAELEAQLLQRELVPQGAPIPARGSAIRGPLRYTWGAVPPLEVLTRVPSRDAVREFPDFYLAGPGRALAEVVPCLHLYNLTDSCPGCDHDEENVTTLQALTVAEERLRDALELACSTAQQDLEETQRAMAAEVVEKGPVRALQLWGRTAVKHETAAMVWRSAVDAGKTDGWSSALDVAERQLLRIVRESLTPTRNPVDQAVAMVRGRHADTLLDTVANFRTVIR